MKHIIRGILILVASINFAGTAAAGIYVEPYLGAEIGNLDVKGVIVPSTPIHYEYAIKSNVIGAKAGWSFGMVGVGVDYQNGNASIKRKDTGAVSKSYSDDLGINLQILVSDYFKIIGTYILLAKANDGVNEKYTGTGYKAGIGLVPWKYVSLNAEWISLTYDKAETVGFTLSSFDLSRSGFLVSLSFPIGM